MMNFCSRALNRRTTSWATHTARGSVVSRVISPRRDWYTSSSSTPNTCATERIARNTAWSGLSRSALRSMPNASKLGG
jgi:hypothetical protein